MKLKISFVLTFCLISLFTFAQSPIGKGGKQLNFGLSGTGGYVPVYVGFDFGVHPDITIGPQAGLDLAFNWLNLSFRGDYHFNTLLNIPQDWDFYAGLSGGYSIYTGKKSEVNVSDFYIGGQIGGRWYWNEKWGLNLEFGGNSVFGHGRFGVSMKI